MKARPFLQGAGVATLYILPFAKRFLDQSLNEAYHHLHPISSVPLAMLLMTLLIWIAGWLAFLAIERLPQRWRNVAFTALALLFVALLIRIFLVSRNPGTVRMSVRALCSLLIVAPIVLLVSLRAWRGFFARCAAATGLVYAMAGFGILVLLPRLAIYSFQSGPRDQTSFRRDGLHVQHANSRIVWILMDELSYDQTFDHREPGLLLPNFDALANRSIGFSDLQPSGAFTEFVVPALLRGAPVTDLKTPLHAQVSFRSSAGDAWHPLDQQSTIFGEAWKLGWNPGVAGWYNPYCRLFPDVLVRCSWQYSDSIPGLDMPLSYDKSVAHNMFVLMPLRADFNLIFGDEQRNSPHRRDYLDVMTNAEDLLRDQRIGFVFLHIPVPHPPGIYDRTMHQLSTRGDYLDNLVLADDTLGSLMKVLRSTPNYEQTTLILSSDHSWRTNWWRRGDLLPGSSWSEEEDRVTHGGKFDPRPVLMVHLPGATIGQVISTPTSVLAVHSILDALLHEQLHTPADLEKLLERQPSQLIVAETQKETATQAGN